jgi:hypothetical protein
MGKACLYVLMICFKFFWPIVHIERTMRNEAAVKRSKYKAECESSEKTWNSIKIVEHGIESSLQLILQLWLLQPFLLDMTTWSYIDVFELCVDGIKHFLFFGIYKASYIQKALGKIVLNIVILTFGMALSKLNKPGGLSICDKPFNALLMCLSILAQITARIIAFRSLRLLKFSWAFVIFLIIHFVIVFAIKMLFEIKSVREKVMIKGRTFKDSLRSLPILLEFIASGLGSALVMIHLPGQKVPRFSFLPHALFFILVLLENVLLACLPYIAPALYPPLECFTAESRTSAVWWVVVLWILSTLAHIIRYLNCHPWARLIRLRTSRGVVASKFCWRRRPQQTKITYSHRDSLLYRTVNIEWEEMR